MNFCREGPTVFAIGRSVRLVVQTVLRSQVRLSRGLAGDLLVGLPDRWRHTIGVARRAEQLAAAVPGPDQELLVVAAWLHDIGYSPAVMDTGFHSLDGAHYLERHGWPYRVCALVAHHSGADYLAADPEIRRQLAAFAQEDSPVTDALAYADQTVGPIGQSMTLAERLDEAVHRHGPAKAGPRRARQPYLRAVEARVLERLRSGRSQSVS